MRQVVVDISRYTFMVTKSAYPKADMEGAQRYVKSGPDKGSPMWVVEMLMLDKVDEGGETEKVTVSGVKPEVTVGQPVVPVGLVAIPWQSNGTGGLAFKADTISLASE